MIILDFYFLGLTYIIVYVGAIMILFLFVIMMVQIHLMPISTSISPRILDINDISPKSVSGINSPISALRDLAGVDGSLAEDKLSVPRTRQGVHTRFLSFFIWVGACALP